MKIDDDEIENALAPTSGLGLLPHRMYGTVSRVRAAALLLARWDRDVTDLARLIVSNPRFRKEIQPGETCIRFAFRKLQEIDR